MKTEDYHWSDPCIPESASNLGLPHNSNNNNFRTYTCLWHKYEHEHWF